MKWYLTEKEQQTIQKRDEMDFKMYFEELGFKVRRLDMNAEKKNPDFEIDKNGQKVIIELKSKFQDDLYYKVATEITKRISAIHSGFNFRFRHYYKEMPSEEEIKQKLALIKKELTTLGPSITLPYALRLGDYRIQNVHRKLAELMPTRKVFEEGQIHDHYASIGDGKMAIELYERNDMGFLICTWLMGNSTENMLVIIKNYIERTLGDAKKQLADYFNKLPVGVFYYNHLPYDWDENNILSLYGDLKVSFSSDPDIKEATIFLGEDRIIREDRKQWLSFIGYINYGLESKIWIYRNGFSNHSLDKNYFKSEDIEVRSIGLSSDGTSITIEK